MARPIDANELLGIERLLDTDVVRQSKTASWLLNQVLHDIQAMPTLTPPNELMEALEAINNAAVAYIEGGPYENDLPGMELAVEIDRLSRDFVRPPNEWVSVEERLPEYNPGTGAKSYWVAKKDNAGNWQMKIAQYCDYGYAMTMDAETEVTWRDWDFTKIANVTHWMLLPAPPTKEE